MARSLFRDIKRSGYLIFFISSISLGRRSGCSKTSTIWVEWPCWNSLTEAFQGMAALSTYSRGDQVRCWRRTSAPICSSRLSTKVALLSLGSLAVFCCLVPFWGATSPSLSSYAGLFFFKFGIACSSRSVGIEGKEGEEWEELRTWGLLLNLTPCSSQPWALLVPCSSSSMPSRLPLLWRCYLDGQSPESRCEHLNAYQARPRHPRYELLEPLKSALLQSEICPSPPWVMSVKRQSPPLVLLLL